MILFYALSFDVDWTAQPVTTITLELDEGRYECPPMARGDVDLGKRLELLHITKTGGSSLEVLAAAHNVSWGACHFVRRVDGMAFKDWCPGVRHPPAGRLPNTPLWHAPPKYLREEEMWWLRNATWFTVVRNPYERIVSSWNYNKKRSHATLLMNATAMNEWARESMTKVYDNRPTDVGATDWRPGYFAQGTLIPQTDYIDERVAYVLRLENLQRDFLCMIRAHGLDWEWDARLRNPSWPGHLTAANLTRDNLRLAEKVYRNDFEKLGYDMLMGVAVS